MGAVSIPVIASSGAGAVEHFSEVFDATGVQAVSSLNFLSLSLSIRLYTRGHPSFARCALTFLFAHESIAHFSRFVSIANISLGPRCVRCV